MVADGRRACEEDQTGHCDTARDERAGNTKNVDLSHAIGAIGAIGAMRTLREKARDAACLTQKAGP